MPDSRPGPDQEDVTQPISAISARASIQAESPAAEEISSRPERAAKPDRAAAATADRVPVHVADAPGDRKAAGAVRAPVKSPARRPASARKIPGNRRNRLVVGCVSAMVLITAGSLVFALSRHPAVTPAGHRTSAAPPDGGAATRDLAAGWIAEQVSHDVIVACDPVMCSALEARGFPAGNLRSLGPAASYPLTSAVVVDTPALRGRFGTTLGSLYAPAFIASFGSGKAQIYVRIFDRRGAAAYQAKISADIRAWKAASVQLLDDPRITLSRPARRQLASGEVDPRLIIELANLASAHPIDIAGFGNIAIGASEDIAYRFADLAETDPRAGMASSAYTRAMVSVLRAEPTPYLRPAYAVSVQVAGQPVLRVGYDWPSPPNLIGP